MIWNTINPFHGIPLLFVHVYILFALLDSLVSCS